MRLCFFDDNRLGLVDGNSILDVSQVLQILPTQRYPYPRKDLFIEQLVALGPLISATAKGAERHAIADVTLLSPVQNPGKVVAAPVNYRKHLAEAIAEPETYSAAHVRQIHETGLFLKASSSVIGPGSPVRIRHPGRRTDHEVELAVVMGRLCDRVDRRDALNYVAGYSIGLDITIRGPEERSMRKSLDTYTVLGPWLVTADEIPNPSELDLALDVSDSPRQRANTRDLIMSVPELIEFASSFYRFEPGDVLLTGTPEGVGPIQIGDYMDASIERIGSMRVDVASAADGTQ
jgi:2,4-diketo-3-deoxy-L-fuconate hydrolase